MVDCFYGELDPYTGTWPAHRASLPGLVDALRQLCLTYDIVLVPPGCMVEHPLALPAFEALAPFVRAGRLGTSGQYGTSGPLSYVMDRAQKAKARWARLGFRKSGASRAVWRRQEIDHTVARWSGVLRPPADNAQSAAELHDLEVRYADLLPDEWSMVRDVHRTVQSYDESVTEQLRALADAGDFAARGLLEGIERLRDAGHTTFDRTDLVACAAALVGEVSPSDLARSLIVMQGAYFGQGSSTQLKWRAGAPAEVRGGSDLVLFPGTFAQRHAALGARQSGLHGLPLERAPVGHGFADRLERAGVSRSWIAALSADELFELASQPEWRALVAALRDGVSETHADALRAVLTARRDPRDGLCKVSGLLGASPKPALLPPTVMPAVWDLAAQARLGSMVAESTQPDCAVLDWPERTLSTPGVEAIPVSEDLAQILALLAIAGDVGLSIDDVERVTGALDALASAGARAVLVEPLQQVPGTDAGSALRTRADQVRRRAASLLGRVGLALRVARGRWFVEGPSGLALRRTPWSLEWERLATSRPPGLAGQLARVWDALAAAAPAFVRPGALAVCLDRDDGPEGARYVSTVVGKLRRRLESLGASWTVFGRYARGYRLTPRLPAGPWERRGEAAA